MDALRALRERRGRSSRSHATVRDTRDTPPGCGSARFPGKEHLRTRWEGAPHRGHVAPALRSAAADARRRPEPWHGQSNLPPPTRYPSGALQVPREQRGQLVAFSTPLFLRRIGDGASFPGEDARGSEADPRTPSAAGSTIWEKARFGPAVADAARSPAEQSSCPPGMRKNPQLLPYRRQACTVGGDPIRWRLAPMVSPKAVAATYRHRLVDVLPLVPDARAEPRGAFRRTAARRVAAIRKTR